MHTHHLEDTGLNAYATLITRPTYLSGALLLAHSLHKHSPSTPLIILYTPDSLPGPAITALKVEAKHSNAITYPVDHLRLPETDGSGNDRAGGMVAQRFIDTWTKLRVFDVLELQGKEVKRLCFLDADMMVFSDPSPFVFNDKNDTYLMADGADGKRVCATHVCVCNLDGDSWAPKSWTEENCAFTGLEDPGSIAPVERSETKGIFNSGMLSFRPSEGLRDFVREAFDNTPVEELRSLKFPDQDFLNLVFAGRWKSLSWRVNALKTWRYWHQNIWRDDQVSVLHYIVDKPWSARVGKNEKGELVAGYKGNDGVTHKWWWDGFAEWERERERNGEKELLCTVEKYVAEEGGEVSEEMKVIGGGAQDFAKKWDNDTQNAETDKKGDEKDGGEQRNYGQGPHGPILRKPMLGERGHGRVVRGVGRGLGAGRGVQPNINPNGSSYMEP